MALSGAAVTTTSSSPSSGTGSGNSSKRGVSPRACTTAAFTRESSRSRAASGAEPAAGAGRDDADRGDESARVDGARDGSDRDAPPGRRRGQKRWQPTGPWPDGAREPWRQTLTHSSAVSESVRTSYGDLVRCTTKPTMP